MIVSQNDSTPVINLGGPEGNAFALIGQARRWAKDLDYKENDVDELVKDMTSSDYKYLVKVFDFHFGNHCTIILPAGAKSVEDL